MTHSTIASDLLSITISPWGAELQSIQGPDGHEYLWQGDPTYWKNRATNCFPMVGRLFEGRYTYGGKSYELPIHGFAKMQLFSPRQLSGSQVRFGLSENTETLTMYPFAFNLAITYTVEGPTLTVDYEVTNLDEKIMPYLIGGHPGFNMPLESGKAFSDYRVRFAEGVTPRRAVPDEAVLDTGGREPWPLDEHQAIALHHGLFDNDAIFLTDCGHEATLEAVDGGTSLHMEFPDFTFLGLWHKPKTEAPYICLEPWSESFGKAGVVEDFASKEEAIHLQPGETRHHIWRVTIS